MLGAAGVASVVNAPDSRAANGDALRVGRNDNSATAPTPASPTLLVYVKRSDGRRYKAELPLTAT